VAGGSAALTINFQINPNVSTGTIFNVSLQVRMDSLGISPTPSSNDQVLTFSVGNTTPPTQVVTDLNGMTVTNGTNITTPGVNVFADDHGGVGVGWIELTDQINVNATPISQQPTGGIAPTFSATFNPVPLNNGFGSYCATSYDAADNNSLPRVSIFARILRDVARPAM